MCKFCKYWKKDTEDIGECRFNPPKLSTSFFTIVWPQSKPDDWCGQFKRIK